MYSDQLCLECGSDKLVMDYESGDEVCTHCGLVKHEKCVDMRDRGRLDEHLSHNSFNREHVPEPAHMSICKRNVRRLTDTLNRHKKKKTITLPSSCSEAVVKPAKTRQHGATLAACATTLVKARREITNLVERLHLPEAMTNQAIQQFRRIADIVKVCAEKDEGTQGGTHNKKVTLKHLADQLTHAACLYLACKDASHARSLEAVLSACKWVGSKTDIKKKQLGKRVLYLMAILGSSSSSKPLKDTVVSYVEQYACQLGWDGHVVRRACDIATKAGIHGLLDGSSPLSAAAGVLYLAMSSTRGDVPAAEENVCQQIANLLHVSSKTIETTVKKLASAS
jgi:transcription initiation factor TFIIB